MPLTLIGRTGQLGRAILNRASAAGYDVNAYDRRQIDLDVCGARLRETLDALPQSEGVIIAAAYTQVDNAQSNPKMAARINAQAPGVIASWAKDRHMPLVHISTDYVFSGDGKTPYKPNHTVSPINIYGQSKLDGELRVQDSGALAAILRTSWVFDGTGKNFLTTMLRLAGERDQLSVVDDQIGRPTYAGHLADAALAALTKLREPDGKSVAGTYHVSGSGAPISWAGFAREIFSQAKINTLTVNSISTRDYPTPAPRPAFSVLDLSAFETTFDHALPDWTQGLKEALEERN